MNTNGTNLLFRNTSVGLPQAKTLTFGLRGGGLQKGNSNFMNIQLHQKQKIWNLLDEFEQQESSTNLLVDIFESEDFIALENVTDTKGLFNDSDGNKAMSQYMLFLTKSGVSETDKKEFETMMVQKYKDSPETVLYELTSTMKHFKNVSETITNQEVMDLSHMMIHEARDFNQKNRNKTETQPKQSSTAYGSARQLFTPDNAQDLTDNLTLIEDELKTTETGKVIGKLREEIDPNGRLRMFSTGDVNKDNAMNQVRLFLTKMGVGEKQRAVVETSLNHQHKQYTSDYFAITLSQIMTKLENVTKNGSDFELTAYKDKIIQDANLHKNKMNKTSPAVTRKGKKR